MLALQALSLALLPLLLTPPLPSQCPVNMKGETLFLNEFKIHFNTHTHPNSDLDSVS